VPFAIVFTKTDKISKTRLHINTQAYLDKLKETWDELPPVFFTSSEHKTGKDELLNYIEQINTAIKTE
jgi:GTP-binding protein